MSDFADTSRGGRLAGGRTADPRGWVQRGGGPRRAPRAGGVRGPPAAGGAVSARPPAARGRRVDRVHGPSVPATAARPRPTYPATT